MKENKSFLPVKRIVNFNDIPVPEIVALTFGNGSGSKLFQSFLDNHCQIYMIPAYPLMYFYPHWDSWKKEYKNSWNWETIINIFCEKHASVIDSRRIKGNNGLTTLGDSGREHIQIDEIQFRLYLAHFLKEQPINSRSFLLAVHYAYALCNKEDVFKKKVLVYHIHEYRYVIKYLIKDFPELKLLAMTRDSRPNIERRIQHSFWNVDRNKLNQTDSMIYKRRALYHCLAYGIFRGLSELEFVSVERVRVIKHDELASNLELTMKSVSKFLGIDFMPSMLQITFGGKVWWCDPIYVKKPINKVNPAILSQEWKQKISKIDWFVIEGILFKYFKKYKYQLYKYTKDTMLHRFILFLLILIPSRIERRVFLSYISPRNHIKFFKACFLEATGIAKLKNYTWNAVYLYKYTYSDLKLWQSRWYVSFLNSSLEKHNDLIKEKFTTARLLLSQIIYIIICYARYWWAIISYPFFIFKQRGLFYWAFLSRLKREKFYPLEISS